MATPLHTSSDSSPETDRRRTLDEHLLSWREASQRLSVVENDVADVKTAVGRLGERQEEIAANTGELVRLASKRDQREEKESDARLARRADLWDKVQMPLYVAVALGLVKLIEWAVTRLAGG